MHRYGCTRSPLVTGGNLNARRRSLAEAGAWLTVTAAAGWGVREVEPSWIRLLCLIVCAGALRIALTSVRTAWRSGVTVDARNRAVIHLRGEINALNADDVTQRLMTALQGFPVALEIGLTRVSHITSDGTDVLFRAARAARSAGVTLVVSGANAEVRTTLRTVGLDRLLYYIESP